MTLSTEITRKLDDGNVQVDIKSKNTTSRHYSVAPEKADCFISDYKKNEKNSLYLSNIAFGVSIFGGVVLTNFLIRNAVKSTAMRYLLSSAGGVIAGIASMLGVGDYLDKKKAELMKQYQAKEIFYKA